MKNQIFNKKPAFVFISGILFGIAIISSFSFMNNDKTEQAEANVEQINVETASQLTQNYFANARSINSILQGFSVNRDQLAAMNTIVESNSSVSGFKIYIGNDRGTAVGVVVGTSLLGMDDVANPIYKTSLSNSGPCPPICDSQSPIAN